MSLLSAIGFSIANRDEYRQWIERTLAEGPASPVPGHADLRLHRWPIGERGLELWAAVESRPQPRPVSFFPVFRARTAVPFTLSALSFPDNPYEPVASGRSLSTPLALIWANTPDSQYQPDPKDQSGAGMDVHVVNYLGLGPEALRPGAVYRARVVGLAGQGISVLPPDEAPFPALFMAARLAHPNGELLPNVYGIAGAVRDFEVITNPATNTEVAWLRLRQEGLHDLEIVGELAGVEGRLAPGQIAFAECYLEAEFE